MASQYQYYGKKSCMSADLKQVMHRVRTNKPELFKQMKVSEMNGEGKVTFIKVAKASPISPSARHRLSLQTERH